MNQKQPCKRDMQEVWVSHELVASGVGSVLVEGHF